jgi:hypothetical protein
MNFRKTKHTRQEDKETNAVTNPASVVYKSRSRCRRRYRIQAKPRQPPISNATSGSMAVSSIAPCSAVVNPWGTVGGAIWQLELLCQAPAPVNIKRPFIGKPTGLNFLCFSKTSCIAAIDVRPHVISTSYVRMNGHMNCLLLTAGDRRL